MRFSAIKYCKGALLIRYSVWDAGEETNLAHKTTFNSAVPYMGWSLFGNGCSSLDMMASAGNPHAVLPRGEVFVAALQSEGGAMTIQGAQPAREDAFTPLEDAAESSGAELQSPELAEDSPPKASAPSPTAFVDTTSTSPQPQHQRMTYLEMKSMDWGARLHPRARRGTCLLDCSTAQSTKPGVCSCFGYMCMRASACLSEILKCAIARWVFNAYLKQCRMIRVL